jgi:hypothetical protein
VGDWYTIGVALGVGVALGALAAGLFASSRYGAAASLGAAVVLGVVAGFITNRWIGEDWVGPLAGLVGGVVGAVSSTVIVRGAMRRGGTAGGTAFLVVAAALMLFVLALVPVVGYITAVVLPARAVRARRKAPRRHAGLRTLAK